MSTISKITLFIILSVLMTQCNIPENKVKNNQNLEEETITLDKAVKEEIDTTFQISQRRYKLTDFKKGEKEISVISVDLKGLKSDSLDIMIFADSLTLDDACLFRTKAFMFEKGIYKTIPDVDPQLIFTIENEVLHLNMIDEKPIPMSQLCFGVDNFSGDYQLVIPAVDSTIIKEE